MSHVIKKSCDLIASVAIFVSVMALFVTFYCLLQRYFPQAMTAFAQLTNRYALFWSLSRGLFIVLFFIVWPRLIQRWAVQRNWSWKKSHFWFSQRIRFTAWLIVVDLFICENLVSSLIKAL